MRHDAIRLEWQTVIDRDEVAAAERGRTAARRDLDRGVLRLRTWGVPERVYAQYRQLLSERLSVELEELSPGAISPELEVESNAYNRVMKAEIARCYGGSALARLRNEAIASSFATGALSPMR